jgi:methylmalonyl-CoA/ethylmalonyl-CoA epimerase
MPVNSLFSNLVQVGVVVKDLRKTSTYLTSLGMGSFPSSNPPPGLRFYLRGIPLNTKMEASFTAMGGIDIELIQPVEGLSPHQEFLDVKGEGIHHIAFGVQNIDEVLANYARQGIGVNFSAKARGGGCAYIDTHLIGGINIELLYGYQKKEMKENLTNSPFSNFIRVGAVVKDLDKTVELLSSLGIGLFEIPAVKSLKEVPLFRGKPYHFLLDKLKTKRARMGGFEFQLYQPGEENSPFKEFFNLKGEGLYDLVFHVDDIEKENRRLKEHNIGALFSGKWDVGGFTYFETAVGGLILGLEQ